MPCRDAVFRKKSSVGRDCTFLTWELVLRRPKSSSPVHSSASCYVRGVSCIFAHVLRFVDNFVCTRLSLMFLVTPSLVAVQHGKNIWGAERTQHRIPGAVNILSILHIGCCEGRCHGPENTSSKTDLFRLHRCASVRACVGVLTATSWPTKKSSGKRAPRRENRQCPAS